MLCSVCQPKIKCLILHCMGKLVILFRSAVLGQMFMHYFSGTLLFIVLIIKLAATTRPMPTVGSGHKGWCP